MNVYILVPGHPDLWRKRIPLQGGPGKRRYFYPLFHGQQTGGYSQRRQNSPSRSRIMSWAAPWRFPWTWLPWPRPLSPMRDEKLANFFKVPMNEDGFFIEKHAKLGPSEFATDGTFLCGMAHYPKPIDESIAQAKAASSRAVTLLVAKDHFQQRDHRPGGGRRNAPPAACAYPSALTARPLLSRKAGLPEKRRSTRCCARAAACAWRPAGPGPSI